MPLSAAWRVVAVVAALGFSGVLAAPAVAGPTPSDQVVLKIAKSNDGPFTEIVRRNLVEGSAKNAYLKLRSTSGEKETVDFVQLHDSTAFFDRYFKPNGDEITDLVHDTGGDDVAVKPGHPKVFRVRVKQTDEVLSDCILIHAFDDENHVDDAQLFMNADTC